MSRSNWFKAAFVVPVLLLVASVSFADKKPPEGGGKVVGVRWQYKVLDGKGKVVEEGTFRAADSKIFRGPKQIGTYQDIGKTQVKVAIDEGKLKGKLELTLVKEKPPTWKGDIVREGGEKFKMTVVFLED